MLYAMKSAVAIAKEIGKDHDAECIMKTYELYRKAAKMHFMMKKKDYLSVVIAGRFPTQARYG